MELPITRTADRHPANGENCAPITEEIPRPVDNCRAVVAAGTAAAAARREHRTIRAIAAVGAGSRSSRTPGHGVNGAARGKLSDISLATASADGAPRAATSTSTISEKENPTGIVDARSVRTRAYLANTSAGATQNFVLTFAAGFATAAKRTGTPVASAAGASGDLRRGRRGAEHCGERADGSEDQNERDQSTDGMVHRRLDHSDRVTYARINPQITPTHDP
jgi:hypothetical protein